MAAKSLPEKHSYMTEDTVLWRQRGENEFSAPCEPADAVLWRHSPQLFRASASQVQTQCRCRQTRRAVHLLLEAKAAGLIRHHGPQSRCTHSSICQHMCISSPLLHHCFRKARRIVAACRRSERAPCDSLHERCLSRSNPGLPPEHMQPIDSGRPEVAQGNSVRSKAALWRARLATLRYG
jgi:hypothetical protein